MHGPSETGETKTYPSMVLMPSLYKIGCGSAAADEQLRFSLGASLQPLCYHPPTRDEELRLSSRWAHKIAGDEGEMMTLSARRGLTGTLTAGEGPCTQTQCDKAAVSPSALPQ